MHGSESGPVVRLGDGCLFRLFWRRQDAFRETPIFEVARLFRADRGRAGDHDDLVGGGELHDLAGGHQRPGRLRARHHQMAEPWREAMAGIVLHRPHLGRRPERVRDALGGALVIGREADADMTIVQDRVIGAVGLLDLVQRLRDEERLQAVARHEGERRLEEVQPTKRGEFVEHQAARDAGGLSRSGPR